MIEVSDVFCVLSQYADMEGLTQDILLPSCKNGLDWVKRHLRDDADENDPLVAETAAAMAHFYFYIRRLTEPDKYSSYRAGDITIQRSPEKELQLEKEMRKQAIANASSILKDGGFYFAGN